MDAAGASTHTGSPPHVVMLGRIDKSNTDCSQFITPTNTFGVFWVLPELSTGEVLGPECLGKPCRCGRPDGPRPPCSLPAPAALGSSPLSYAGPSEKDQLGQPTPATKAANTQVVSGAFMSQSPHLHLTAVISAHCRPHTSPRYCSMRKSRGSTQGTQFTDSKYH